MILFIIRRVFKSAIVILLISVVVYFVVRLAPGNPVLSVLGGIGNTPSQIKMMEHQLGLDLPLYVQYFKWIIGIFHGNLGDSLISHQPVLHIIFTRLPASVELIVVSVVLGLAIAVPLGIIASVRPGKLLDQVLTLISVLGMSTPVFWLGLILIMVISVRTHWLPASGYVPFTESPLMNIKLLVMPAITLGIFEAAVFFRFVRNTMLDVLNEPFIETAVSKGLSPFKVYLNHAFRNTLLTLTTVLGLELGTLLSGTVIVETVFGWTGLGWLVLNAVSTRDYTVVQGTVLFVSFVVVMINLCLDLMYRLLDPRVKSVEEGKGY